MNRKPLISAIANEHQKTVTKSENKAIARVVKLAQNQLAILKEEGFGGKDVYICSGNGSCFLSAQKFHTKDTDPRWKDEPANEVNDDVDVLDYLNLSSRKYAELVCSLRAKKALIEIYYICEWVKDENLTTCFPWKLRYNSKE